MAKRRKQADHRANLRNGKFLGIPTVVLESPAYIHLDAFERAVFVEIVLKFDGYNNGEIVISQRQISDRLRNTNFRRIGKAIATLMEHGLIDVTAEGAWAERKAREYRLTFVSSGKPPHGKTATDDYRYWTPKVKSGADDVSAETTQSADDVSARRRMSADDVSARIAEKRQKPVVSRPTAADDVSSLIVMPYPGTKTPRSKTDETGPPNASGPSAACAGGPP